MWKPKFGDKVKINNKLKRIVEERRWNPDMLKFIGSIGVVERVGPLGVELDRYQYSKYPPGPTIEWFRWPIEALEPVKKKIIIFD